jgi:nucleotide-binding universal stress UspA family protein
MYKQILIAMDETEVSKRAARRGTDIAKRDGARIIGVHILDVEDLNIMDVGSDELLRIKSEQRKEGERALQYLEKLSRKNGVDFEKIIKEGEPDREIVKIADVHDVDLIIMGTHGRKGFGKLLRGDTTKRISKAYPNCPIMLVE